METSANQQEHGNQFLGLFTSLLTLNYTFHTDSGFKIIDHKLCMYMIMQQKFFLSYNKFLYLDQAAQHFLPV